MHGADSGRGGRRGRHVRLSARGGAPPARGPAGSARVPPRGSVVARGELMWRLTGRPRGLPSQKGQWVQGDALLSEAK